jgi:uncharacterized membrane protein
MGYTGLELLWRGRTHGSMFLLGGACFVALGKLKKLRLPLPLSAVLGSGIITAAELATGLTVNRSYNVWDYRSVPLNFMGHICLPYSLLWIPVSLFAMGFYHVLDRKLSAFSSKNGGFH